MGRRTTKERVLSVVLMFVMVFSLITGISVTEVRAEGDVIATFDFTLTNELYGYYIDSLPEASEGYTWGVFYILPGGLSCETDKEAFKELHNRLRTTLGQNVESGDCLINANWIATANELSSGANVSFGYNGLGTVVIAEVASDMVSSGGVFGYKYKRIGLVYLPEPGSDGTASNVLGKSMYNITYDTSNSAGVAVLGQDFVFEGDAETVTIMPEIDYDFKGDLQANVTGATGNLTSAGSCYKLELSDFTSDVTVTLTVETEEHRKSVNGEVLISSDGSIANSNTSRNVAVGQDGTIYVCWHSASGVFVAKSTDNGKSFSEGIKVADGNYECEVTVSSIGRVYVAYRKDSELHVAYSDDKGATFTDVTAVSSFSGGSTVHIATDGSHVYVVGQTGTTLVKSNDGGVTYKTVTISSVGMAYSDIFVDAQTHMITVVEDAPEVIYYTSTDYGETFSEAYIPMVDGIQAMVYYSVGTGGKTNGTTYAYMAGGNSGSENQFLYRINPLTNETIKVDVEDCSTSMGRSITADDKGNVAVGFTSSDGTVSFQVSHDGGETFGDSVAVAYSDSSNATINPVTGELMFLYVNQEGAISLKTYAGKLTGYAITTDPASLSFYKEEGAVGKKVSILCNGEDTAITNITATGDFTVSYEGELPNIKNGESFLITVQYKNTADAALTGSVEITYGTGSKVTLPITVYENVGGVEYKYGINIDSANGDVTIYADDEPLEEPQSYKNKTIKLVATPKTGYNFTGWTVVSGGITLSSASEATTTFTMPQGAVSIKADYELAGTAGAEDKKKVEDAQKEAEEVLAALTPDNNETENDIIEAVRNALKDAGLEDVEVAIENFNKTEATTENPGSVTGTLKLTSGGESKEIPFEKEIAKLTPPEQSNKDAEKVAAAKEAVEKALDEQKVTNDITKEELLKAAQDAAGEGVEVTIENFNKTEATTEKAGSVSGIIKITSGKESAEVPFEKSITKLVIPNEANIRGFVIRLYENVLGRTPEEAEVNSWVNVIMENESSGVDAGYGFIFSQEQDQEQSSNEDFVEMLYETFIDRPADEEGKTAWVSQLDAGVTREKVFEGFVNSPEYAEICENYGIPVGDVDEIPGLQEELDLYRNQNAELTKFVTRCYTKALGRGYDEEGLEGWCRALITGENTPKEVASIGFLSSDEFTAKNLSDEEYVKVLYRTFLGREAEGEGLESWLRVLASGEEDREDIINGFVDSEEFGIILADFGLE